MLERIKHLLKDTATYGLGSVVTQILGFLLIPFYTRALEPSDFGIIAIMSIVNQVYLTIASLGFRTAMYKEFFDAPDEVQRNLRIGTAILTVMTASLVLAAIGVSTAPWLLPSLLTGETRQGLLHLELATSCLSTVEGMLLLILQAARQVRIAALYALFKSLFFVLLNVLLVVQFRFGIWGYLWAELGLNIAAAGSLLYVTRNYITWRFDAPGFTRMWRYGLPFMPSRLIAIAMNLFGTLVVAKTMGTVEAGLFNVASRFASPFSVLMSAFSNTWSAYKFKARKEEENKAPLFFAKVSVFVTFVICYLWVGVSVWGPEVLRWLTPARYHEGATLVAVIALGMVPFGIGMMTGTGYELADDTSRVPLASALGLAAAVVTALILVPLYGAFGAALATFLANSILHAGYFWIARRQYPIPFRFGAMAAFLLIAMFLVSASLYAQTATLGVRIMSASVITILYPIAGWIILAATGHDTLSALRAGRDVLARRFGRKRGSNQQ